MLLTCIYAIFLYDLSSAHILMWSRNNGCWFVWFQGVYLLRQWEEVNYIVATVNIHHIFIVLKTLQKAIIELNAWRQASDNGCIVSHWLFFYVMGLLLSVHIYYIYYIYIMQIVPNRKLMYLPMSPYLM